MLNQDFSVLLKYKSLLFIIYNFYNSTVLRQMRNSLKSQPGILVDRHGVTNTKIQLCIFVVQHVSIYNLHHFVMNSVSYG